MLTNVLNLPQPIFDAVRADPYSRGEADESVTGLLKPPRMRALEIMHGDAIEEDASDRIWSLMGQSIHTILERANASGIVERRLFMNVNGWRISGAMDRIALVKGAGFRACIQDYKMASVYEIMNGVKPEREQQLNCYAELCRANGYSVDALQAVFILRDWSKAKARREADYPQRQVCVFDIPLWPLDKAHGFLVKRVDLHREARTDLLPWCTDEERWKDAPVWAVMKEGRKSALRLYPTREQCVTWCYEKGYVLQGAADFAGDKSGKFLAKGISIEHRPSVAKRCRDYCAVADFCEQHQLELEETN